MTDLDFSDLWGQGTPKQQEVPKEIKDTNEYTSIKKEYQQYIQFNKELDQQRKEVNKMMTAIIKESKQGKPNGLLDDTLKVISLLMRDEAFYKQVKANLKDNPHIKPK